jgi:predicted amidohydrolase
MRLALLQEKHNDLYAFLKENVTYTKGQIHEYLLQMEEQNLLLMKSAGQMGADLALTSEAINFPGQPWWTDSDIVGIVKDTQNRLKSNCSAIACQMHMYIAVGMYQVKEDGKLYNSVLIFDRTGQIVFSYDKNFLAGSELEYLTPGNSFPVWNSEFGKIGLGICWDMQFPETARAYALQDADMILCPTWGWESLYAQARAYENGIYVAATMAVPEWGDIEEIRNPSQVIAPDGNILGEATRNKSEVLLVNLPDIRDCRDCRALRIGDLRKRFPSL